MDRNTLYIDEKILWKYKSGYRNNEGELFIPALGEPNSWCSLKSIYYPGILVTEF